MPGTFGNGINLIGRNLETSFHMSNASLGAVAFIAQVSQLLWAVPLAVWADRGSRKKVAAIALLIFAAFGSLMAISPNVWAFAFLYLAASVGTGVNNTVHNSYLSDAYPTESRGRIFSWHNLSDPLSQTIGILIFGYVVTVSHDWRYGLLVALAGIPLGFALFTLREPEKGANESSHILKASGMDLHSQQEKAPRVLLGSAVTRLLRIRSLYFELVAVAILGFAGTGAPLFGNLFFIDKFHLDTASRSEVYAIIGLAAFLGLPLAYVFGDRYFRRAPQRPLVIAGICITAYGGPLRPVALRAPALAVRDPAVPGQRRGVPAGHLHLPDAGRHRPARNADHLLRHVRGVLARLRRLHRLGAARRRVRRHRRPARHRRGADASSSRSAPSAGCCSSSGRAACGATSRWSLRTSWSATPRASGARPAGDIPALQIHNLDFFYGTNQVLFDVNLEIHQGEMVALLGTNGAGKSTLLRAVSGLSHPHRGVVRLFGMNSTYLEPEQIIDEGVALLVGGKMTFPGLSVRDNLRIGSHTLRKDRAKTKKAHDEALEAFPELAARLDQPAGTLSGGEQQMLALSRVMMTAPRLLMIDELALGLAPMTVERLMAMVRRINDSGTTVILVEQSLNRALSLAERCFFMERGEIRFDGPTAELMARDDLLRPVFLGSAAAGLS